MNTKIEITDAMVDRLGGAIDREFGGSISLTVARELLEAALNSPPAVCKNCGKPRIEHTWNCDALDPRPLCPGYVWEPNI